MGERNRVEALSICAVVIITSSSYWRKTGILVNTDGWISVANFKMDSRHSIVSCPFQKVVKKLTADAFPMPAGKHREEQQL